MVTGLHRDNTSSWPHVVCRNVALWTNYTGSSLPSVTRMFLLIRKSFISVYNLYHCLQTTVIMAKSHYFTQLHSDLLYYIRIAITDAVRVGQIIL